LTELARPSSLYAQRELRALTSTRLKVLLRAPLRFEFSLLSSIRSAAVERDHCRHTFLREFGDMSTFGRQLLRLEATEEEAVVEAPSRRVNGRTMSYEEFIGGR